MNYKYDQFKRAAPFSCVVIKSETDVTTRALIAGKMQAMQQAVQEQTLHERVAHLAADILGRLGQQFSQNFKESLQLMYVKGGFVASKDSLVCPVGCL